MRRAATTLSILGMVLVVGAGPALACGGLVSPNGTIALVRTTTLAAYHNGLEHYVTGFEFAGKSGDFGSVIPLPGIPSRVIRGGDWTLQRLEQEVQPLVLEEALTAAPSASGAAFDVEVILQKQIDALDITILKGGGHEVARWVTKHGFTLPPDAPEVLEFYGNRSPVFMAVKFDAERAAKRGRSVGDAIPVHLVIPTDDPWVPLRILALGAKASDPIDADIFLLNDDVPTMLPAPLGADSLLPRAPGLTLARSERASRFLLSDLRSDKGMKWLPRRGSMWLSYLELRATAGELTYDLAIDSTGTGMPSPVDAGLLEPGVRESLSTPGAPMWPLWAGLGLLLTVLALAGATRRAARPAV
jgi:hypothetical protein